jgi:hypothetical protein
LEAYSLALRARVRPGLTDTPMVRRIPGHIETGLQSVPLAELVPPEEGTAHGFPLLPMIINVFMHCALDQWMGRKFVACPPPCDSVFSVKPVPADAGTALRFAQVGLSQPGPVFVLLVFLRYGVQG